MGIRQQHRLVRPSDRGITGKPLGEVFKTRIFEPLGMRDSTFDLTDALRMRLAVIHARNPTARLRPCTSIFIAGLRSTWAAMALRPWATT